MAYLNHQGHQGSFLEVQVCVVSPSLIIFYLCLKSALKFFCTLTKIADSAILKDFWMLDKGYLLRVVIKGTAAKHYQGVISFNTVKY